MHAMRTMGIAPVQPPDAKVDAFADEYVVHLGVSGFAREELEVEVMDRVVTVCGDQTQAGFDGQPFRLHERLEERFELPADADARHVTASYSHGGLELRVPRRNGGPRGPHKVPVDHRLAVNTDASGV